MTESIPPDQPPERPANPPGRAPAEPRPWAKMPARVYLTGWLLPATMADADLIARLMGEHERLSRAEPGCLVFEIFRSMSDPMRFAVREVFADRACFNAHQARTRSSDWWRQTAHIERDYRISEGE